MKFDEEEERLITEAVSKLCIWEGHKDCLECQDCPKFADDDCNLYDVMMDLFEKAKNQIAKKLLDGVENSFGTGRNHWMYQFVKDALKEFCEVEIDV